MVGFFKFAKEALAAELDKFRNRQFLDATMAASALVSLADGDANITELNILDQALETIQKDTDRDFIMSAPRAKEYGIIDEVISKHE